APELCLPRPPVVAILGHVDHGKTTLLDALRSSRMVDEEYGGITQHLAAFSVSLAEVSKQAGISNVSGLAADRITFLDTPGHAAFSAIRARGARVTDIVILVVAADDGVMPQTVESIRFAKEAKTPIVVAINKIDKKGTDVGHVIEGLAAHGVVVERLGGDVQAVEISALKKLNLENLLEAVILQAELMQLRADPTGPAEGIVLEAKVESGTGKVATCLVTRGVLRKTPEGGPLVAGEASCSPRLMFDDMGRRVSAVQPGCVAKVAGWKELPIAGSTLLELDSPSRVAEVVRYRRQVRMQRKAVEDHEAYAARMAPYQAQYEEFLKERSKTSRVGWRNYEKNRPDLVSIMDSEKSNLPTLHLIIKADAHGSVEAIKKLLSTCPSDQCLLELGLVGVGPLTESEVEHAEALGATVLLFNVSPLPDVQELAKLKEVSLKQFNIIYRLAEEVREMMNALLPPRITEQIVGEAEILQLFQVRESRGTGKAVRTPVAGCRCTRGHLLAGQPSTKSSLYENIASNALATYYRVVRPKKQISSRITTPTTSAKPQLNESQFGEDEDPLTAGTVLISRGTCRSLRHERTSVDSIRKGVECGLTLVVDELQDSKTSAVADGEETFFSGWQPGDIIQCYVLVPEPRTVQWQFETKCFPVDGD
ncbi:Translation initiation factor IF-2 mitochondrial, partial [Fasciolopsis buskii]